LHSLEVYRRALSEPWFPLPQGLRQPDKTRNWKQIERIYLQEVLQGNLLIEESLYPGFEKKEQPGKTIR
jgi:hypothetical protein